MLQSTLSVFGEKVSSDTGNYKPRPHTISSLLILNYALASKLSGNWPAEEC